RQNKEPVVLISLDDYKSIEETAYLMQSMTNASRLNSAIAQLEAGQGTKRELIEE
ncbi:MAG: antitoxin YefM, partial [Campylobacterota bacterium]|nr:antitoxin YefM [Campylobacterota bacterium]